MDASKFFKILGVLIIVVVAACIAFFATCFGGFFAGAAIAPRSLDGLGVGLTIGIISGSIAAVAVIGGLIWLMWVRPRRKRRAQQ
jgi:hypothetical protein